MRKWLLGIWKKPLSYFVVMIGVLTMPAGMTAKLTLPQQRYLDAKQAFLTGNMDDYRKLRAQLKKYPLNLYLDFYANVDTIKELSGQHALAALAPFKNSPLYRIGKHRYLVASGQEHRWRDFITVNPTRPRNTFLQCDFYRANLAVTHTDIAFDGAKKLWLHGHSRPKECDPLFLAWEKSGGLTQKLIWSRMLLAFNASNATLLNYLAGKITLNRQPVAQQLLAVYNNPYLLSDAKYHTATPNIIYLGLKRLARKDIVQAVKLYHAYQKIGRFSHYTDRRLHYYLVRRALIKQEDELKSFIDSSLGKFNNDSLKELRLRWAIREADQLTIDRLIQKLEPLTLEQPRWQYWLAKKLTAKQDHNAKKVLATLSHQRNFYGFAAADQLGKKYILGHRKTVKNAKIAAKLSADPGFARVKELLAIDQEVAARAEWIMLLRRHNKKVKEQYARFAFDNRWYSLAVQATIQAKLWDDVDLRFPYAANSSFHKASKQLSVDIDELRAIARRESAFYPYATSGVGARGLMQLMPKTARQTAKHNGIPYNNRKSLYDPDINIQLGSHHYAKLLKQFDGNRILATAAYNAGASNVKRWLRRSAGKLDAIAFIESIPYGETRDYVQAVLSYRVIYQLKQRKKPQLFSRKELSFRY